MSDRMIMEGNVDIYHPRNSYYYDSEDNYEPDIDQDDWQYRDFWKPTEMNQMRRSYTTAEVMGEIGSGVLEGTWYRMDEIPETFISSFGAIWSVGPRGFWIPRRLYCGRENHAYWVIYVKQNKNGQKMFYLHRLLAKYFIPNPNNYPLVRHLNDDGLDCRLENLAWGTQTDNMQDCIRNGHFRKFTEDDIERAVSARRTPVIATNLETGEEVWFPSQQEASRQLGVKQSTIHCCVTGKTKGKFLRTRKYNFREAEE